VPKRDQTRQSRSPWTLGSAAPALADCPRTTRREAAREGRAETLRAEQRGVSTGSGAASVIMTLARSMR